MTTEIGDKPLIGTCELCGDPDVVLIFEDFLTEFYDGVACQSCCDVHIREKDRAEAIEFDGIDDCRDYW